MHAVPSNVPESFLHQIFNAIPDPFYVIDVKTRQVIMANQATKSRPDLLATCHALTGPSQAGCHFQDHPCPLEMVIQSGHPVTVTHTRHLPDQTVRTFAVSAFPVFDPQGQITAIIEHSIETTEQTQTAAALLSAQTALEASNRLLSASQSRLIEAQALAGMCSWEYDLAADRLTWTAGLKSLKGLANGRTSLKLAEYLAHVHPDERLAVDQAIQHSIQQGLPGAFTYRIRLDDGRIIWVQTSWRIICDQSDTAVQILGALLDITHLKEVEKQLLDQTERATQLSAVAKQANRAADGLVSQAGASAPVTDLYQWSDARNLAGEFSVPAQVTLESAARTEPDQVPGTEAWHRLQGVKILLVEDNLINQEIIIQMLHAVGAIVTVADNGFQAVEAVRHEKYDLILMDIQMPGFDGLKATQAIRRLPGWADVPIIAQTAHVMTREQDNMLASGINDIIAKPIHATRLYQVLGRWISQQPLNRPRISGLDIDAGLRQIEGDWSFMSRLLVKFYRFYQQELQSMKQMLAEAQYRQLYQQTHTLKALSGTISARQIYDISEQLDKRLKQLLTESDKPAEQQDAAEIASLKNSLPEIFEHLTQSMQNLFISMEPLVQALQDTSAGAESELQPAAGLANGNGSLAMTDTLRASQALALADASILAQLQEFLTLHDVAALPLLQHLRQAWQDPAGRVCLSAIYEQASHYNFPAASKLLQAYTGQNATAGLELL